MRVIIRADASVEIGSGHVMRCLTIADKLRKVGHQITFWMLPLKGNLIDYVVKQGYLVTQHPQLADLIIVDHYQLDVEWESKMRAYAPRIAVIDDLANRYHDCDVLIDQNMVENYQHRYNNLVPEHCKLLLGPKFLVIRDEFLEARKKSVVRLGEVKRLLVFMGGSDPTQETVKILDALTKTSTKFEHIDVVVGSSNINSSLIEKLCVELKISFHCQINYIAKIMRDAHFSIGAGGSAIWERCFLGLPSASTIVAENQRLSVEMADSLGATLNLGWHEHVNFLTYVELLDQLPKMSLRLQQLSKQGLLLTEYSEKSNAWLDEFI